jgi:hypothetical protein
MKAEFKAESCFFRALQALMNRTRSEIGVSHGCIRLANWDIVRLAGRVKAGVPVSVHTKHCRTRVRPSSRELIKLRPGTMVAIRWWASPN